jgi:hypothetical protein
MNRSMTFLVALAMLVTACGDNSPDDFSANSPGTSGANAPDNAGTTTDAPCLDELTARVEAVRVSVDALEHEDPSAPADPRATYEALAADLDDLEADLDTVESSLDAAETQVAELAPQSQELLNALGLVAQGAP